MVRTQAVVGSAALSCSGVSAALSVGRVPLIAVALAPQKTKGRIWIYMTKNHARRLMLIVVAALVASLALASSALATEHHPKGIFAPFNQCPLSNPAVGSCTVAETTSGEFDVGKRTVPIVKPIKLQGGFTENEETGELTFYGAENGETLQKVALPVPGGLLNVVAPEYLPKWLQEIFNNFINEGLTGVTATTELAQSASHIKLSILNLIFEEGVALQLPVQVKLGNVFLGSSCIVGSSSHPIILNLTTGETSPPAPNKPIHGASGTLELESGGELARLTGGSLVDNAFAAPGAHGCGGFLLEGIIDEAVNAELGLPAAAGKNTAILNGKFETATASAVRASE
jgi:hypothetical protein